MIKATKTRKGNPKKKEGKEGLTGRKKGGGSES